MAAASHSTVPISVTFEGTTFTLQANLGWKISHLKNSIAQLANTPARLLRIVFAGAEIPDETPLRVCNLASGTVVHAVASRRAYSVGESGDGNQRLASMNMNDVGPTVGGIQRVTSGVPNASFYVFCKKLCKTVSRGKLRVRCKQCKDESFEVDTGPNCWEDVLEANRITGRCNGRSCRGNVAEFYFRCAIHSYAESREEASPMSLVRANIQNVPCLACTDVKDVVLVFRCADAHVICLDCFGGYCKSKLDDRGFVLKDAIGYTISCPGNSDSCRSSFINEVHHFLMAGLDQYERYKNFAAEEYVLQNGGVLCPSQNCGHGILLDNDTVRIVHCNMCRFQFCRTCRLQWHEGACPRDATGRDASSALSGAVYDVQNLMRSRWRDEERQSHSVIERTTKQCPGCLTPTEKSGGCNHMTCSRCRKEWCWLCCANWTRTCQGDHWFRAT